MFFRFGTALVLVVLIALAATALEKRNLELKRAVSRQHYRLEILEARHAAHRVLAEQLGAPSRLIDELDPALLAPAKPEKTQRPAPRRGRNKRHTASDRSPSSP